MTMNSLFGYSLATQPILRGARQPSAKDGRVFGHVQFWALWSLGVMKVQAKGITPKWFNHNPDWIRPGSFGGGSLWFPPNSEKLPLKWPPQWASHDTQQCRSWWELQVFSLGSLVVKCTFVFGTAKSPGDVSKSFKSWDVWWLLPIPGWKIPGNISWYDNMTEIANPTMINLQS